MSSKRIATKQPPPPAQTLAEHQREQLDRPFANAALIETTNALTEVHDALLEANAALADLQKKHAELQKAHAALTEAHTAAVAERDAFVNAARGLGGVGALWSDVVRARDREIARLRGALAELGVYEV